MSNNNFLEAAVRLCRNSGNDIDTIGMESETKFVSINIYGDNETNYEMMCEVTYKKKNKWIEVELSNKQIDVLEIIFKKEVDKVFEDRKLEEEIQEEIEQHAKDVEGFYRVDVVYGLGW